MTPRRGRGFGPHVHHEPTALAVEAERGFLRRLEGGCQVPVAAYAEMVADGDRTTIRLRGRVVALGGERMVAGEERRAASRLPRMPSSSAAALPNACWAKVPPRFSPRCAPASRRPSPSRERRPGSAHRVARGIPRARRPAPAPGSGCRGAPAVDVRAAAGLGTGGPGDPRDAALRSPRLHFSSCRRGFRRAPRRCRRTNPSPAQRHALSVERRSRHRGSPRRPGPTGPPRVGRGDRTRGRGSRAGSSDVGCRGQRSGPLPRWRDPTGRAADAIAARGDRSA